MRKMYQKTFITMTMDQHFPDADYISFDGFSAEEEVQNVLEAGFDSLFVFTKCHWGYTYHDTAIGTKHPALGERDMLQELVQTCNRHKVEAIAYHSIVFDNLAVRMHPEWSLLNRQGEPMIWNREGKPMFDGFAQVDKSQGAQQWRFNEACINTGYRDYTMALLREIVSNYDIDGVFIDIFGVSIHCFCPECLKLYALRGIDPYSLKREEVFDRIEFWWERWSDFLRDIHEMIQEIRPGICLFVNGTMPSKILQHATFPYSEGGDHPHHTVVLRGTGMKYYQCGIGCGDMADIRSADLLRIQTANVLANGGRALFFMGPGRGVDGRFEKKWFDYLQPIVTDISKVKEYLVDSEPIRCAAVYVNEACASDKASSHYVTWMNLWKGISGILGTFRALHIPCEFIPDARLTLDEIKGYQLLIVPEVTCMSDRDAEILTSYVHEGGNLLVTGETGLRTERNRPREDFILSSLLGISYHGENTTYDINGIGGYLRTTSHPFFSRMMPGDYSMKGSFLMTQCVDAEPIARIAEPIAVETPDAYIGWQPLSAGIKADWPAITHTRRGKGQAIYCAAPLGKYTYEKARWPGQLLEGISEFLGLDAGITIHGPKKALDTSFTQQENRIVIHLLNQNVAQYQGERCPIHGVRIEVDRKRFHFHRARVVYPAFCDLQYTCSDERAIISVPPVDIHMIVLLEQE
jgi:hypothetical protein